MSKRFISAEWCDFAWSTCAVCVFESLVWDWTADLVYCECVQDVSCVTSGMFSSCQRRTRLLNASRNRLDSLCVRWPVCVCVCDNPIKTAWLLQQHLLKNSQENSCRPTNTVSMSLCSLHYRKLSREVS